MHVRQARVQAAWEPSTKQFMPKSRRISVIIPALNEAPVIVKTLNFLQPLRERGHEVIVVDGGSQDATKTLAMTRVDHVLSAPAGRALQMSAGARSASGQVLWFLHADTLPPAKADSLILTAMERGVWGRFDVRLSGSHRILRIVERLMNLRSRLSGIATGDQGIFVRRVALDAIGGVPLQPLMEDIELSRRLKRLDMPVCLRERVITSSRRWEEKGVVSTILFMWRLRFAYALGVDPTRLAHRYYDAGKCPPKRPPQKMLDILF